MEIKRIETYSLYEFCKEVQEALVNGWRFDFDSNELFPTAFGSMLVAGMVKIPKETAEVNTSKVPEDNTEVNSPKRGRPAK